MLPQCLPPSFTSIWLSIREQVRFEDFQDEHCGSHLGYWNKKGLAILNIYVTLMPPIKFQLNPIYYLGDAFLKNFKMAAVVAILEILN